MGLAPSNNVFVDPDGLSEQEYPSFIIPGNVRLSARQLLELRNEGIEHQGIPFRVTQEGIVRVKHENTTKIRTIRNVGTIDKGSVLLSSIGIDPHVSTELEERLRYSLSFTYHADVPLSARIVFRVKRRGNGDASYSISRDSVLCEWSRLYLKAGINQRFDSGKYKKFVNSGHSIFTTLREQSKNTNDNELDVVILLTVAQKDRKDMYLHHNDVVLLDPPADDVLKPSSVLSLPLESIEDDNDDAEQSDRAYKYDWLREAEEVEHASAGIVSLEQGCSDDYRPRYNYNYSHNKDEEEEDDADADDAEVVIDLFAEGDESFVNDVKVSAVSTIRAKWQLAKQTILSGFMKGTSVVPGSDTNHYSILSTGKSTELLPLYSVEKELNNTMCEITECKLVVLPPYVAQKWTPALHRENIKQVMTSQANDDLDGGSNTEEKGNEIKEFDEEDDLSGLSETDTDVDSDTSDSSDLSSLCSETSSSEDEVELEVTDTYMSTQEALRAKYRNKRKQIERDEKAKHHALVREKRERMAVRQAKRQAKIEVKLAAKELKQQRQAQRRQEEERIRRKDADKKKERSDYYDESTLRINEYGLLPLADMYHSRVALRCVSQKVKYLGMYFTSQELFHSDWSHLNTVSEVKEVKEVEDVKEEEDSALIQGKKGEVGKEKDCVVCMSEHRTTVMYPCRHMCLCVSCAIALKNQLPRRNRFNRRRTHNEEDLLKCPICRSQVNVMVFLNRNSVCVNEKESGGPSKEKATNKKDTQKSKKSGIIKNRSKEKEKDGKVVGKSKTKKKPQLRTSEL
jgi:hypothetical protein